MSGVFSKILSSASKLVLLMFSFAIIVGLFTGNVSEDTFKVGALMVLTYYFTHKGDSSSELPYGGK